MSRSKVNNTANLFRLCYQTGISQVRAADRRGFLSIQKQREDFHQFGHQTDRDLPQYGHQTDGDFPQYGISATDIKDKGNTTTRSIPRHKSRLNIRRRRTEVRKANELYTGCGLQAVPNHQQRPMRAGIFGSTPKMENLSTSTNCGVGG